MTSLKAPFPYFGGKRKVSHIVWQRFGDVTNYVEPFFGSGAVLLGRPDHHKRKIETVNDLDGFVANFWRALQHDPGSVTRYADNPVNENDLHARHVWLVNQIDELRPRLEADPEYYDAKVAGYWVWGMACWIGSGFCSGNGPWQAVDGKLVHLGNKGRGVNRQRVHLGNKGQGVNRQRVHLGNKGRGVNRQLVHLGDKGQGVNRKLVHLGDKGQGVNRKRVHLGGGYSHRQGIEAIKHNHGLFDYMTALSDRLSRVRVASGDWSRVCGPSVTFKHGLTGVFLDPPYNDDAGRASNLYRMDNLTVAHEVREWAIANGNNPKMRIALCGLQHEHGPHMPKSWSVVSWNAGMGFSGQGDGTNDNGKQERVWFSPHCIGSLETLPLFADLPTN